MPCDYRKYPKDWKEIRQRILDRAGHCCERCGLRNHTRGYRDEQGVFWTDDDVQQHATACCDPDAKPLRPIRIVLTVAHIHNPNPMNCDDSNLQALCQQCHKRLDARMRARNAAATRRAKSGQLELL